MMTQLVFLEGKAGGGVAWSFSLHAQEGLKREVKVDGLAFKAQALIEDEVRVTFYLPIEYEKCTRAPLSSLLFLKADIAVTFWPHVHIPQHCWKECQVSMGKEVSHSFNLGQMPICEAKGVKVTSFKAHFWLLIHLFFSNGPPQWSPKEWPFKRVWFSILRHFM